MEPAQPEGPPPQPTIPARRGRGRPPIFVDRPDVRKKFLDAVAAGNYLYVAAQYAGINYGLVGLWMQRGQARPNSIYGEFLAAVKDAQARAEVGAVTVIRGAALGGAVRKEKTTTRRGPDGVQTTTTEREFSDPQWAAAAWLLERHHPMRWGRRDRTEAEFEQMAALMAAELGVPIEELKREAMAWAERARERLEQGELGHEDW